MNNRFLSLDQTKVLGDDEESFFSDKDFKIISEEKSARFSLKENIRQVISLNSKKEGLDKSHFKHVKIVTLKNARPTFEKSFEVFPDAAYVAKEFRKQGGGINIELKMNGPEVWPGRKSFTTQK